MRLSTLTRLAVVAALAAAAPAAEPSAALLLKEKKTFKRVASELLRLADYCSRLKAYDEARAEIEKGLAFQPEDKRLLTKRKNIEGKENKTKPGYEEPLTKRREKTYRKCVQLLSSVAKVLDKAGHPLHFERYVALVRTHFPSDEALKNLGLSYFEPYALWFREAEHRRLLDGGEQWEGRWLSPAEVHSLNAEHSSWKDPWVLEDEVHEVRTVMPLRTARTILVHVGAFRRFFLSRFGKEWDLKPPTEKLPVIVTETQRDLVAQARKVVGQDGPLPPQGAAYYLQTNMSIGPCFVTFEPKIANGGTQVVDLPAVLISLRHEITHQIAFEYSKHDFNPTRRIQHQFWCVEGIANFMQNYEVGRRGWYLTHPRTIRMGRGMAEGDFAWCEKNLRRLPDLETFMNLPHKQFMTIENYHLAATLAYFLLHGEEGRYRKPFLELLETVHKVRDDEGTFKRCFGEIDMRKLRSQFEEFVRGIRLD
ncbi:MAG: hypothetical protein ACYTGV_17645 [Planctomycetota bacterium]